MIKNTIKILFYLYPNITGVLNKKIDLKLINHYIFLKFIFTFYI